MLGFYERMAIEVSILNLLGSRLQYYVDVYTYTWSEVSILNLLGSRLQYHCG